MYCLVSSFLYFTTPLGEYNQAIWAYVSGTIQKSLKSGSDHFVSRGEVVSTFFKLLLKKYGAAKIEAGLEKRFIKLCVILFLSKNSKETCEKKQNY